MTAVYRYEFTRTQVGDFIGTHLEGPKDAFPIFQEYMKNRPQEIVVVMVLDAARNVIGIEHVATGTDTMVAWTTRDTFRLAVQLGGAFVVLAHRHTIRGETTPSEGDMESAAQMQKAGDIMQIPVLQQLVVTDDDFSVIDPFALGPLKEIRELIQSLREHGPAAGNA
jgi:DNA repair protein RadC